MIEVKGLLKKFKEKIALDIPELKINPGEAIGIVGDNGAGKTTFFNLILDLLKASEGEIYSKGVIVAGSEKWKAYTSSYIDHDFLVDFLTPSEYFNFIGSLKGLDHNEIEATLEKYDYFRSEDIKGDSYIRDLSKGNKTRVGILGALLGNPEILLFDEPFSSLDPSSQMNLRAVFKQLHAEGKTLLISSHDLEHITTVTERILIIKSGKVTADLRNEELNLENVRKFFIEDERAAVTEATSEQTEENND